MDKLGMTLYREAVANTERDHTMISGNRVTYENIPNYGAIK